MKITIFIVNGRKVLKRLRKTQAAKVGPVKVIDFVHPAMGNQLCG